MSIQSSSSTESSPSLYNHPVHPSVDDAGAAHFNPLFIYTASAAHINHNYKLNHSFNLINNTSTNKMAGNTSPNPMHPQEGSSRKVHVVYYLSRSGQLEHPHLLEVSIPPNQGLHLRDVKKRLAAIRGKRLPMTFAWSYKRSYKNGYVWQDLCDDDLIFPAHGCEYVLKGSEIMNDQSNNEECGHTPSHIAEARLAPQNGSKEDQGITNITLKAVYQDDEESQCAAVGSASLRVSMVESGTDAATQTEENLRPSTSDDMHEQETASKRMYTNLCTLSAKQSSICSPHKTSCTTTRPQHATELNKGDIASPPSSSSTANSPSPYKEIPSTSSSSTSGFNTATDHNDNIGSNDRTNIRNCNLGSKTPGRTWMKRGIHKLEEQDEVISLHAIEDEGECESIMNDGGSTNSAHENSNNKTKHRGMGGNSTIAAAIMEDVEHSPLAASAKPSRGKHSGALSLLQFMSCGGLDIKEQILPMSLYRLRSKGAPASTANQLHMSNYTLSPEHLGTEAFGYGGSEAGNLWTRIGKPKSLYLNSSKRLYNASDEYNGTSDVDNQQVHRRHHYSQHEGASVKEGTSPSPMANGSSALKAQGGNIPDVISIGRSSISDRSTNVSHELEYQVAEAHAKLKKSGEVINNYGNIVKSSPRFNARPEVPLDSRNSEGIRPITSMAVARAVSGEILMSKGSPLFVPGKRHLSYSGTPLNYAGSNKPPLAQLSTSVLQLHEAGNNQISTKLDSQNKACSSSCNPSRAFSEGEVSCMLANRNAMSKSGDQRSTAINGYDQSMAQLWEELLAAPAVGSKSEEHQHNDADYQRVRQVTNMVVGSSSSSSREVERDQRTLQNAVELSLQPPLEHLMLHHQPHHHHHHLLDCPQCGRKVKAEVLKAHVKTCSSPKSNNTKNSIINNCMSHNNNGLGKSPKSDSNLCQRFLRASPPPPPTKL